MEHDILMSAPTSWRRTRLGDVASKIQTGPFGSQLHASDYVESGIPCIMPKNIINGTVDTIDIAKITAADAERLSKHKVKPGDIIYSRRGDVEKCALIREEQEGWLCGTGCLKVSFSDTENSINSRYIAYFLSHPEIKAWIVAHAVGATMPNLNTSILSEVPFLLPPLQTQKTIASTLGGIDDKIAINQQINQTLEAMAQACFKSWFVDFEPTRAKMIALAAGGTEEDATLAAMSAISGQPHEVLATLKTTNPESYAQLHTAASLFPSRLMESELGEIPEGWEVSEIGKEVTVVGGGTPSTKKPEFWDDGDIPWTTPKDLSNLNDKILIDTDRKITKQGLAKISSGLLPVNTVLMSSRAPVGYLALAKVPVAVNQGYIAMKCEKNLTPEYVLQWCAANMDDIKLRASGTTFAEISKSTFRPMTVLIPEAEVLQAYSRQVAAIYSQIETLVRENHALASMRDSLLPKLLSGEIIIEENHGGE